MVETMIYTIITWAFTGALFSIFMNLNIDLLKPKWVFALGPFIWLVKSFSIIDNMRFKFNKSMFYKDQ